MSIQLMTEQHSDELELIEKIRSGDRTAFNTIVERLSRRVLNLCYRLTGNKMDAEDITQDVFVEVYRNCNSDETAIPPNPEKPASDYPEGGLKDTPCPASDPLPGLSADLC